MPNDREILTAAWSSTGDCPEVAALLDCVERGDEAVRRHLGHCPRCTAEIALYRHVTAGPAMPDAAIRSLETRVAAVIAASTARVPARASWWRRLMRPAILVPAAAAFAALLIVITPHVPRNSPLPTDSGVYRAQSVELLTPKGEVVEVPEFLRWSPVNNAASYRVRILEVDRNIIWEAAVKPTTVRIPPSVRKQVLPGKRLIWSVEALDAGGQSLATATQDFRRTIPRKNAH